MVDISIHQRRIEIAALILTAIAKFIVMDLLNQKLIYIVATIIFWLGYISFRTYQDKSILAYWGFNPNFALENLFQAEIPLK